MTGRAAGRPPGGPFGSTLAAVTRRAIPTIVTLAPVLLTTSAASGISGGRRPADGRRAASDVRGTSSFQSDGWIKLCGLSTGCVIDPPPHPWLGRDVYNTTGRRQTVSVDIDEGEGVRFWITVENDGTESDTLVVQGCRGTRYFEVNRVVLGKRKRPDASYTDVTRKYKRGELTFDLESGDTAVFTLNIITHTVKGETYRCLTTIHSENDSSSVDTVVGSMTTY